VIVPLMYGPATAWCRNILAAGQCTLTFGGEEMVLTAPEVTATRIQVAAGPEEAGHGGIIPADVPRHSLSSVTSTPQDLQEHAWLARLDWPHPALGQCHCQVRLAVASSSRRLDWLRSSPDRLSLRIDRRYGRQTEREEQLVLVAAGLAVHAVAPLAERQVRPLRAGRTM
jgi:hypothetical protein